MSPPLSSHYSWRIHTHESANIVHIKETNAKEKKSLKACSARGSFFVILGCSSTFLLQAVKKFSQGKFKVPPRAGLVLMRVAGRVLR